MTTNHTLGPFFFHFSSHRVYRTAALTRNQVQTLGALATDFDFWKQPVPGKSAEIRASPDQIDRLQEILLNNNVDYELKVRDVEE